MAKKATKKAAAKKTVAELKTERVALGKLLPHPKNPRVHPEKGTEEWEVLKRSLEHDYFDPIVWNKRNSMLVSGHFRVKVLTDMGYTAADVVVVDYDENTHLARLLAANRLLGEDDEAAKKDVLTQLFGLEFDMGVAGFSITELEGMGFGPGAPDLSSPPPPASNEKLGGAASAVKYVQLIYASKDYEPVRELIEKAREQFRPELIKRFGKGKEGDPANVVWFALEKALGVQGKKKR